MGPPLTAWPHSHPKVSSDYTKCLLHLVDNIRTLGLNFTFGFILLQVLFNLSAVTAGPVVLNFDYLQGEFYFMLYVLYFNYDLDFVELCHSARNASRIWH